LEKKFEVTDQEPSPEELLEMIPHFDALIVRSRTKVTRDVMERGKNLKVIGRAGVGVDNIDLEAASERGIKVVNAPTGSTISVAELALAHMLCLSRHLSKADSTMKDGKWEKKSLKGVELYGKTLGLVGSGRIGGEVVKRARAFGMRCISYDPYLPKNVAEEIGLELVELDTVLTESDYISIHAALTDETRHILGKDALSKMKPTAYLINCARGGIVDEDALVDALSEGKLAGAALDVFECEPPGECRLLELDNLVSFTPHIGASTQDAQIRVAVTIAEQVGMALEGKDPEFWVNRK